MDLPPTQLSDEAVAKAVQQGRVDAFEQLVLRYEHKLLRYARKFLLTDIQAQDAVQEVFIKAYVNIKSFDSKRKFAPWIYRIAHNEFVNSGQKRSRELMDFFDFDAFLPHPAAKDSPETDFQKQEMQILVNNFLEKLDPKYREPLILYYLEDLNYQEISDVLKIPVPTVGVRLNRAKALLRKAAKKT